LNSQNFILAGFIEDEAVSAANVEGLPYLGSKKDLYNLAQTHNFAICTASVGPASRKAMLELLVTAGFELLVFCPSGLGSCELGSGSLVSLGSVFVGSGQKIGSGALVSAPGVSIAESIVIGAGSIICRHVPSDYIIEPGSAIT
jgi:acetyltransferase-like isoleucine patch superfamily enzyme